MSVPPGDRNESPMQFIETADKIELRAMQVCKRWPKTYMFIITQRTIQLASEVYEHAQKANANIPQTEREREDRISDLVKALGATYAFARKIERAYSMFPLCGDKNNVSKEELAEKSDRLLEEFMILCLEEEKALKGNIHYVRNLKLPEKKGTQDEEIAVNEPEKQEETCNKGLSLPLAPEP